MKPLRNPKYILPNGLEWKGNVHQMDNGDWMTGKIHSESSIHLALVDETWNLPQEGSTASQKVFKQIFNYLTKTAGASENLLQNFNKQLSALDLLLDTTKELLNTHVTKVKKYLESKVLQNEDNGRGTIIDSNLNITLPESLAENKTAKIASIEYIHGSENPYFLWAGNIEAGIAQGDSTNPNNLDKAMSMRLFADMVSRTGASTGLVDPTILKVTPDFSPGFSGKFLIKLIGNEILTNVHLPLNTDISSFKLNENTDTEIEYPSNITNFEPTKVSTISFEISEFTEPIPFSSCVSEDLQEDFLGEGLLTDSYQLPEDIYQRTRLEIGPIGVSLKKYEESFEKELGPYFCSAGSLTSINFTAEESLSGATPSSDAFKYFLVIQGKDYEITPTNRGSEGNHTYKINSSLDESTKTSNLYTNTKFIDLDTPPVSWKLKVKLNKSEESQASPAVTAVKFTYLTSLSGGINV